MSTAPTQPANSEKVPASAGSRVKTVLALLIIVPVALVVVLEVTTLLAEQATEAKRREIGKAGGRCDIERQVPAWIQKLAGEESHSFLDRSVIIGVTFNGNEVEDSGVASIVGLNHLRVVRLDNVRISEEALKTVAKVKSLQRVTLVNTPIQDVSALRELPELEDLNLNYSKVRAQNLSVLAEFPQLRRLALEGTQMRDAGVAEVSKCSNLEDLNISGAVLGEHGLRPLQARSELKLLMVKDSRINPSDLKEFREAVPHCTIAGELLPPDFPVEEAPN